MQAEQNLPLVYVQNCTPLFKYFHNWWTLSSIQLGWFGTDFKTFFGFFGSYIAPFGARRGFKMILSHMAPSCVNMSSYRAIWTHFRSISMISEQIKIPTFIYMNFRFLEKLSLFVGRSFFQKLFTSKIMQSGIDDIFWGQTFKTTFYLTLDL